jgi:hypothetical protein
MSKSRIVSGILLLGLGIGIFGFYVWSLLLADAVKGMVSITGPSATESITLFAQLAPPGAIISIAIAFWLLLGPSVRKLFSSMRRGGRGK